MKVAKIALFWKYSGHTPALYLPKFAAHFGHNVAHHCRKSTEFHLGIMVPPFCFRLEQHTWPASSWSDCWLSDKALEESCCSSFFLLLAHSSHVFTHRPCCALVSSFRNSSLNLLQKITFSDRCCKSLISINYVMLLCHMALSYEWYTL